MAIVLAAQTALAQTSFAAKEKEAADGLAKFIAQTREEARLPRLRRIHDRHLRADACRRAGRGDRSVGGSTGISPEKVGTLSVSWFSTLDPSRPPLELAGWAKGPDPRYEQPRRFAVGVCLVNTPDHAELRYYIDVGTYMSAIKSILNAPMWD
jgi:hypothetical protein